MSGHSKWATTKRQKAVTDAARSRVFTKLAKLITIAARQGGGDPATNMQLRYAIDRARAANVPRDNIDRAIKRGTGALEGATLEEFSYEAVGPGGAALIIEGVTDSKNRTHAEIRNLVEQHGAKLAEPGSQRWQFERVGSFAVSVPTGRTNDEAELAAIEAGAEDTQAADGEVEVVTKPDALTQVRDVIAAAGWEVTPPAFRLIPKNALELTTPLAEKVHALAEALLDHDDVQSVALNTV